jgi:hypothetical protein
MSTRHGHRRCVAKDAMNTVAFLGCLGMLFALPAWGADAPEPPSATSSLEQCELYPLAEGTQWIYRSGPLEVREKVTCHEEFRGELCARVETLYEDRIISFEHIAVRDDGVYRVAVGGKAVEPPLKFISLPARAGAKWAVNSLVAGKTIRGEFTSSEGTWQARSPQGDRDRSFKTYRVSGEDFQAGGESVSFTYEFVPHVGKVRQTARVHGLETTIDLRDIVPAGQTPTRAASGSSLLYR